MCSISSHPKNLTLLFWVVWLWASLCATPSKASADSALQARLSYRKAYLLFKKKQWKLAQTEFRNTLKILQKRHAGLKGRKQQFNTLGIGDIRYHLAVISWKLKRPMTACHELQRFQKQLKTLPNDPKTGWQTWAINPLLPKRFQDAEHRFQQHCVMLPSQLTVKGLPPKATIAVQKVARAGQPAQWQVVSQPIPLVGNQPLLQIRLRLTAPGFLTQKINVTLQRWSRKTIQVKLKKKPKPRIIPRRRPPRRPPPPPPRTSPWVWLGVGLGTAALTTGIIVTTVILTQPKRPNEVKGSLEPNVWQK